MSRSERERRRKKFNLAFFVARGIGHLHKSWLFLFVYSFAFPFQCAVRSGSASLAAGVHSTTMQCMMRALNEVLHGSWIQRNWLIKYDKSRDHRDWAIGVSCRGRVVAAEQMLIFLANFLLAFLSCVRFVFIDGKCVIRRSLLKLVPFTRGTNTKMTIRSMLSLDLDDADRRPPFAIRIQIQRFRWKTASVRRHCEHNGLIITGTVVVCNIGTYKRVKNRLLNSTRCDTMQLHYVSANR